MDYIKQINNDLGGGYIIMKDFSNHLEYNQQAVLVALQIITHIIHDNVPVIKVVIDMFDETRESNVIVLDVVDRLRTKRQKFRTKNVNFVEQKHIVDEGLSSSKENLQHGKTKKVEIVKALDPARST